MERDNQALPAKAGAARGRPSLIARFVGNRKGSTAIEFTMLAIPFSLLVFAILESCIAFAAQQLLSTATDDVARELRTGQIKAADVTPDSIKTMICNKLQLLVSKGCPDMAIDLEQYATFADAATVRIQYAPDHDIDTSGFKIDPGPSMSKNMLRVFYRWPVMTDFMAKAMSNLPDGKTLLFATDTWQNEPFDD